MQIDIIKRFRLYADIHISIKRIEKREGICSLIYGTNEHVLLWDFDEADIDFLRWDLISKQIIYKLPKIYILQSSESHYHAYCFCKRSFRKVIEILSATDDTDLRYIQLGIARGYFTLRFSPKRGEKILLFDTIESEYPDEISPDKVTVNEYYTTNI